MIDAVVLAGAANTGALRQESGALNTALIDIGGRPMASYVISALRASGVVGRIIVVGPVDLLRGALGSDLEYVADQGSLLKNLLAGLSQVTRGELALVATSDIPFLTGESVADFVRRCEETPADLYYPVVERSTIEARFPDVQRTYVRLVDGEFTGGNLILARPQKLISQQDSVRSAIELRKKPVQLARMLGISFIIKLLLRRLTIADIECRVGAMVGIAGKGVIMPSTELGIDVDKVSDLELARKHLA